ncbi:putative mitochondrial import receptor subunit TOM7 [Medicago truncatula]|uniref:Import receptor subunit TOM7-1 n=1 Tax=Medicago truncatula TaxID=3880 RepID=G7J292_MEDTR|nr:import receptor subunit TOM7-1 [Medicago truncatula]RHN67522.1 putative mitochondrial import receptor subunit TOM7 [Medicago truncatula]
MVCMISLKAKGKSSKKRAEDRSMIDSVKEWKTWGLKKTKVIAHCGFIPLIIIIGMTSDQKPQLYQLLSPVRNRCCLFDGVLWNQSGFSVVCFWDKF